MLSQTDTWIIIIIICWQFLDTFHTLVLFFLGIFLDCLRCLSMGIKELLSLTLSVHLVQCRFILFSFALLFTTLLVALVVFVFILLHFDNVLAWALIMNRTECIFDYFSTKYSTSVTEVPCCVSPWSSFSGSRLTTQSAGGWVSGSWKQHINKLLGEMLSCVV